MRRHARKLLVACLLISATAQAATLYCGPSSTGAGTGSNFSNLLQLPNATGFTRGNTYIIIEGSYGSRTLSSATSGSTTITIRKASAADSAVTGYASSLHDAAATFADLYVKTGYWIVDGVTRTETTRLEAPAGYGIRVTGTIYVNSLNGDDADFSQFSYLDVGGEWSTGSGSIASYANAAIYFVYDQANITFTRCVFHNSGHNGALAMMHGSSDIIFDHCDFYQGWGKATIATPNVGQNRHIIRYCRFWNSSQRDPSPDVQGAGLTCELGTYSYSGTDNWESNLWLYLLLNGNWRQKRLHILWRAVTRPISD